MEVVTDLPQVKHYPQKKTPELHNGYHFKVKRQREENVEHFPLKEDIIWCPFQTQSFG